MKKDISANDLTELGLDTSIIASHFNARKSKLISPDTDLSQLTPTINYDTRLHTFEYVVTTSQIMQTS